MTETMASFGRHPNWAVPGVLRITARRLVLALVLALGLWASLLGSNAYAWGSHALAAYRVFENMPEVAQAAPVKVEPLEVFLKAQEKPIAALLAQQEAWMQTNLPNYFKRTS